MSNSNFVLAGIMGWPVAHSRSPVIHNHWIKQYGLNGSYVLLPVQPQNLSEAIRGLKALGFAGCNVTIPHKVEVLKLMDYVDPVAKEMGAVNMIVVGQSGELRGFNTDGAGYIQSLRDVKPDWRADAGPIVVLGAGGAARAILMSLVNEGAKEIRLINRTRSRADELAAEFGEACIKTYNWEERHEALDRAALLVNVTNQGMHGEPPLEIHLDRLPPTAFVSDAIYIPLETDLLAKARARGNLTVNGLGMLINQARPAFEAWFGIRPEVTQELRDALAKTF